MIKLLCSIHLMTEMGKPLKVELHPVKVDYDGRQHSHIFGKLQSISVSIVCNISAIAQGEGLRLEALRRQSSC